MIVAMRPDKPCNILRIVSGGQTGADRAALDWAIANHVPHGGWCPRGRKAEDGVIDGKYQLNETESDDYRQRTKKNVIDSDGTLILNIGALDGGSLETARLAGRLGKPQLVLMLDAGVSDDSARQLLEWLQRESIGTVNVAGPRESKRPGIYALSYELFAHATGIARYRNQGEEIGRPDRETFFGCIIEPPPYRVE
jgi:hypothetical protein